jgi:hypothetical protein
MTRALAATLVPVLLVPVLLVLGGVVPAGSAVPGELRFERLNRGYRGVAPEILPIEEGPLTIRLTSPRNDLTVRSHRLRLEPGAGNSHSAELRIEFTGKGWLVADVEAAGLSTRLEDEVRVPPQALEMQGRVRVRRVQGGYEVTPEQLPRSVSVRIESGIGRQLMSVCDGVAALPLTEVDCPALERALTRAVVPLPAAGESFLLEDAELTPEERGQLDGYLRGSAP